MSTIWIVYGKSESSDVYLGAFKNQPTKEQLEELFFSWDSDEDTHYISEYEVQKVDIK